MSNAPGHVRVRHLGSDDAPAYAALRLAIAQDNPIGMGLTLDEERDRTVAEFATQLDAPAPALMLGAFDGQQLVATAGLARPTPRPSGAHKAVLWGVLTAPGHRGQGLARDLSERLIAHAWATGTRRIYLYVYLPNPAALHLYKRLGFVATGLEPEVVHLDGVFHDLQQMSLGRVELSEAAWV